MNTDPGRPATTNLDSLRAFVASGIDMLLDGPAVEVAPRAVVERLVALQDELGRRRSDASDVVELLGQDASDLELRRMLVGAIDEALDERRLVARFPVDVVERARALSAWLEAPTREGPRLEARARPKSLGKGPLQALETGLPPRPERGTGR